MFFCSEDEDFRSMKTSFVMLNIITAIKIAIIYKQLQSAGVHVLTADKPSSFTCVSDRNSRQNNAATFCLQNLTGGTTDSSNFTFYTQELFSFYEESCLSTESE